ncbi:N-acetylglucosamine-6-phosphate deacetylase [Alkaliphilus crotonatoxidans]
MIAIKNGKIILEDGIVDNQVLLFNEKVVDLIDYKELKSYGPWQVVDAGGQYVSPGFIDIHLHGSGGCDTMDGSLEALQTISETIIRNGTTGFLPTTMTMELELIHRALAVIREAMNTEMRGAQVLGAHMEGPFINKAYKGAQNPGHIISPNKDYLQDYLDVIRVITLAPEVEGGRRFLEEMSQNPEIILSIGHSKATYTEAMEAIEKGIRHATHLFNAMTPLHHRDPGVVGAVFNSQITCELIADQIHVHPDLFRLIYQIKGKENLILITDAIRAGCMKDGIYDLGGQEVTVREGSARLADGSLAGSLLTLNQAVRNFAQATELPLHEVIRLVSLNPARLIGLSDQKGSIKKGKDADLIIFNDKIEINRVFVGGVERFSLN